MIFQIGGNFYYLGAEVCVYVCGEAGRGGGACYPWDHECVCVPMCVCVRVCVEKQEGGRGGGNPVGKKTVKYYQGVAV